MAIAKYSYVPLLIDPGFMYRDNDYLCSGKQHVKTYGIDMNTRINQKLYALAESDYKAFNEKLIPTGYDILGIRMPALKKLAKEIAADPEVESYLENAEYTTYDHILLYGLVVGQLKKPLLETVFQYIAVR